MIEIAMKSGDVLLRSDKLTRETGVPVAHRLPQVSMLILKAYMLGDTKEYLS